MWFNNRALLKSVECVTNAQLIITIETRKNKENVVTETARGVEKYFLVKFKPRTRRVLPNNGLFISQVHRSVRLGHCVPRNDVRRQHNRRVFSFQEAVSGLGLSSGMSFRVTLLVFTWINQKRIFLAACGAFIESRVCLKVTFSLGGCCSFQSNLFDQVFEWNVSWSCIFGILTSKMNGKFIHEAI